MTARPKGGTWRLGRAIGGVAGILGGFLLAFASVNGRVGGPDQAGSSAVGLAALILLAASEIVLVRELARTNLVVAVAVSAVLVLAGVLATIGFYSLLSFGALVGVAYAALGVLPWLLAAPLIAILIGRRGILGVPPAIALVLMTVFVFAASASRVEGVVLISYVAYGLAWSWVGLALLNAGIRRPTSR